MLNSYVEFSKTSNSVINLINRANVCRWLNILTSVKFSLCGWNTYFKVLNFPFQEMADENDFDHLSLLSVESVGDKLSAGLDFDRKRHLLASMSTLSSVSSVTLLGAGCGSYVAEDSVSCASMPGEAFPQVYPLPLSFLLTILWVYEVFLLEGTE